MREFFNRMRHMPAGIGQQVARTMIKVRTVKVRTLSGLYHM